MAKKPSPAVAHKPAAKKPAKAEKPAKPAVNGAKAAKPAANAKPAAAAKPPEAPAKKPRPDLATKIIHLIGEDMAIEEAELTDNASFKEDLGLDEIDIAELLMQAEQEFSIGTFGEDDWESCETVGDFVKLIEAKVAQKKSGKKS